jgi:hypothetical protein
MTTSPQTPADFGLQAKKKGKQTTVYMDELTKFLLTQYGGGNLSRGIREAARAVSTTADGTMAVVRAVATPAAVKPPERKPAPLQFEVLCAAPRNSDAPQAPSRVDPADSMFGDLFGTPYDPNDPD